MMLSVSKSSLIVICFKGFLGLVRTTSTSVGSGQCVHFDCTLVHTFVLLHLVLLLLHFLVPVFDPPEYHAQHVIACPGEEGCHYGQGRTKEESVSKVSIHCL